jgi:hypothetical protein
MRSQRQRVRKTAVAVGVAVLLAAPTFAQTRGDINSSESRVSTIGIGFPSVNAATEGSGALDAIPLEITDELRELVHRMWRTSPTFRRQCARLLASSVRVVVRVDPTVRARAYAVTTVDVRDGFVRAAGTRLGVVQPEYLAHELEHVLEQLDAVDLRWAVKNGVAGARETPSGALETVRAIAVGRLVAEEVDLER